jgi:hypothetical protein
VCRFVDGGVKAKNFPTVRITSKRWKSMSHRSGVSYKGLITQDYLVCWDNVSEKLLRVDAFKIFVRTRQKRA